MKLKMCPFCGGETKIGARNGIFNGKILTDWFVYCKRCDARSKFTDTKQDAVDAWNVQVKIDEVTKRCQR